LGKSKGATNTPLPWAQTNGPPFKLYNPNHTGLGDHNPFTAYPFTGPMGRRDRVSDSMDPSQATEAPQTKPPSRRQGPG